MAFHELNEIKRDRQPYEVDYLWKCIFIIILVPFWSPLIENTIVQNTKLAAWGCGASALLVKINIKILI